jgi:hypothetical protein
MIRVSSTQLAELSALTESPASLYSAAVACDSASDMLYSGELAGLLVGVRSGESMACDELVVEGELVVVDNCSWSGRKLARAARSCACVFVGSSLIR